MIKDKNILVAGGAGFIGTHLVETLLSQNNFISIIDNFNNYYSGKEENIKTSTQNYILNKDYEVIKGDLLDVKIFSKISVDIDIIFNLAAQAGVRYSIEHPIKVSRNNILSALNILNYALNSNIKKLVYASTSSVYGNPVYTPVDESHPKNPISPYSISKLCGEFYVDYYYREFNLSTTSLRFYTVYGPRGRPDMAIRKFFELILENKEITIYGEGNQKRDFTYVSDIIDGLILACESPKSVGEVFNLGCSNPIILNDLIDKMYEITNKSKKLKKIEKQKGDVDITHADITKAQKMLNYHPKVDIDTGLRKTYEWQLKKLNI